VDHDGAVTGHFSAVADIHRDDGRASAPRNCATRQEVRGQVPCNVRDLESGLARAIVAPRYGELRVSSDSSPADRTVNDTDFRFWPAELGREGKFDLVIDAPRGCQRQRSCSTRAAPHWRRRSASVVTKVVPRVA